VTSGFFVAPTHAQKIALACSRYPRALRPARAGSITPPIPTCSALHSQRDGAGRTARPPTCRELLRRRSGVASA
jgi:hypothetical protein